MNDIIFSKIGAAIATVAAIVGGFFGYMDSSAVQVVEYDGNNVGGPSSGTINTLDQWVGTTSPDTEITQRVFGKGIRLTGLNSCNLDTDANGSITCGTDATGGGGSGSISTSSPGVISSLLFYTTAGATPELVNPVATTTLTGTSPLSFSSAVAKVGGSNSVLSWDFSVANSWTGLQTFSNASTTGFSCLGIRPCAFGATATSSFASTGALTLATPLLVGSGGTGQSTFTSSQLLYGNGTNAISSVATSSLAVGASISSSGTLGAQVGGTASSLSLNMANANTWTALQTFANSSTTVAASFAYASSTLYHGAGLSACGANSWLSWASGVFGCTSLTVSGDWTGTLDGFEGADLDSTALGSEVTGTLPVANGGTGVATFTSSQLLYGNGTSALTSVATSSVTCTTGASCTTFTVVGAGGSTITTTLGTSVDLTTEVTGDLPFANLAQVAGNSVLGNITGATADAASVATSSLFAGTSGQVLGRVGGTWAGVATTTFSTGITYLNGAVTCDTASAAVFGCLSSANWSTFNSKLGSYDAWTHPAAGYSATTSSIAVGTSTAAWPLTVYASAASQLALSAGAGLAQWTIANEGGNLYFSTTTVAGTATSSPAAIEFRNSGTALGIATSSPWRTLSVVGTMAVNGLSQATGDNALCIDATSKEIEDANGATCALSTILAKENVLSLNTKEAVDILSKLRPVSFDWKKEYQREGDTVESVSLIAEEVEIIDPRFVDHQNDGKPHGLSANAFIGLLVSGFQDLLAKITGLEARLNAQQQEINELKARLDKAGL